MGFLIRAAFWLSLVILILPAEQSAKDEKAHLSTAQALAVAQATLNDFTTFCSRQPDVCAAGEVAIENFSAKARYGAKQLYMYLDSDQAPADPDQESDLRQAPGFSQEQGLDRQQLSLLAQGLAQ